jgi:primosomal protein N' (replication factor Y)
MFIDVALNIGTYSYSVPGRLESRVQIGSRVRVPVRKSESEGWVTEILDTCSAATAKEIHDVCWDAPLIGSELMQLGSLMACYYQSSLGSVLDVMVPKIGKTAIPEPEIHSSLEPPGKTRLPLAISDSLSQKRFKKVLLFGVNRKRMYFEAVDSALRHDMGAVFLVPEIRLIPEVLSLFQKRFGGRVAVLHSGLRRDQRWAEWLRVKEGIASIVIGTMSAAFAPVRNLGVIVVDEEQDRSYKSSKHPRYSAPVISAMRARIESCLCISGSSSPSTESFHDTENGKSTLVRLVDSKGNTGVSVVDMRKETDPVFSSLLRKKLKKSLDKGGKVLLFLNRRGSSYLILCEDCGYIPKCHDCGISLVYHGPTLELRCRYCGYTERAVGYCPDCKGTNLSYKGVGTAKAEKAFREMFPDIEIFRLDLDTVDSKRSSHVFNAFLKGDIQVLLGTQIVAKSVEFPQVDLVGVISSDVGLNLPDFRSSEHAFSLLTKLGEKGNEMVVQTYNPGHPVFRFLRKHDYIGFYHHEKLAREEHDYPPFSHLVRIVVENRDQAQAEAKSAKISSQLRKAGYNFLGPSPCPIPHKRGKFRMHFLLKTKNPRQMKLAKIMPIGTVVDVDPVDLL